jgi:O-antigen ligase
VRSVLLLAAIAIIGVCTVFAQSRGGQLVFLTATGVYFVRRFGFRGMILGAALATPMLLLGGRSGDEADSSADERTMCLYVGMKMFRDSPLFGVGKGQFVEHHTQTAHNSYVLAAAELGLPGMVLWALLLYLSMKIPFVYLRRTTRGELALSPVAQIWAVALSASLAAMYVGIFFLSFSYHDVLWISLGLAGAFYAAVRRHVPTFEVRVRWPEVLAVSALSCALLTLITLYAGWKVSHGWKRPVPTGTRPSHWQLDSEPRTVS